MDVLKFYPMKAMDYLNITLMVCIFVPARLPVAGNAIGGLPGALKKVYMGTFI